MSELEHDVREDAAVGARHVVRGTCVATLFVAGILMLCTPALSRNLGDQGLSNFPLLPLIGIACSVTYLVLALLNSWWIRRWMEMPPIGWFAAVCNYVAVMFALVIATGIFSDRSLTEGLAYGFIATLLLAPVGIVAIAVAEGMRWLGCRSVTGAITIGAIGVALWVFVVVQTQQLV